MGKGNRSRQDRALETVQATETAPKNTKLITTIATVAVAALLVACIVLSVVVNTGIVLRTRTAAKTDNYSVSGTEMAYLIYQQAQQMASFYQQVGMTNYTVDTIMSMDNPYGEGTYADYFAETAMTQTKQNLVLCEYAKANGISLSEEDKEAIDATMDEIAEIAASNFYSTNAYIKLMYGNGINANDIRKTMETQALASAAYEIIKETFEAQITDEKMDEHVKNNVQSFYTADYLSYGFIANLNREGAEATEEEKAAYEAEKAAMLALAVKLEATKTEAEFKAVVADYLVNTLASKSFDTLFEEEKDALTKAEVLPDENTIQLDKGTMMANLLNYLSSLDSENAEDGVEKDESTEKNDYQKALDKIYDSLKEDAEETYDGLLTEGHPHYNPEDEEISELNKWLFDEATAVNSTKMIDDADDADTNKTKTTYTVYMLKNASHLDDAKTQDVAHLLVSFNEEGTDPTDEEKATAKAEAEKLLADFLAGENTLEAFKKLAEEKTDDSNVVYENVKTGEMVEPFEDWIFDENRTAGETGIVETEYGYHIMYYIGEGMPAWKSAAHEGVLGDLFEEWVDAESAKVGYKANESVTNSIIH